MIQQDLIRTIRQEYQLPWRGIHGVVHWARVLENGLRLAGVTGADAQVVALFAVFHDSRRVNEDWDPHHGRRGAQFAAQLRGKFFQLPDHNFRLLQVACEQHTDGLTDGDVTVRTCWDADRLDLGRVGMKPHPNRLCTVAAKGMDTIEWAYDRSVKGYEPEIVAREWDVR